MTDEKDIRLTNQRLAAEVDAVYEKLIEDLHAYSENPLSPEEVLKIAKEKAKEKSTHPTHSAKG